MDCKPMTEEEFEDWASPVECNGNHGNLSSTSITNYTTSPRITKHYPNRRKGGDITQTTHPRTIVHIDLDCYYAQVEMVRNPTLRNKPIGIQQKYLLVTCNYIARSRGVTKLMGIGAALQKCPELVIINGEDLTHYREMSYRITDLLRGFSPMVERLGFDENFIDITHLIQERLPNSDQNEIIDIGHLYGDPDEHAPTACTCGCRVRLTLGSQIANEMRAAIRTELGLTGCAGIAHNKLLAKLVGASHKPNDQTTLLPDMTQTLISSLKKATQVPGIGHSTGKKLAALGIATLDDVTQAPFAILKDEFGYQTASTMCRLCNGHDESPVIPSGPPQSLSDEDSFRRCSTTEQAKAKMGELINNLIIRLKQDGRRPHTLRLGIRRFSSTHKWKRESRQCPIPDTALQGIHTDELTTKTKLLNLCLGLFHKLIDASQSFHLTLLSIGFAKFSSAPIGQTGDISTFFTSQCKTSGRVADKISDGLVAGISGLLSDAKFKLKDQPTRVSPRVTAGDPQIGESCDDNKCGEIAGNLASSDMSDEHGGALSSDAEFKLKSEPDRAGSSRTLDDNIQHSLTEGASNIGSDRLSDSVSRQIARTVQDSLPENSQVLGDDAQTFAHTESASKHFVGEFQSSLSQTSRTLEGDGQLCPSSNAPSRPFATSFSNDVVQVRITKKEIAASENTSFFAARTNSLKNDVCSAESSGHQDENTASGLIATPKITPPVELHPVSGAGSNQFKPVAPPPHVDPGVFSELPGELQEELLKEWQQSKTVVPETTGTKHGNLGPDIDRSVFDALPQELQTEILQERKFRKRSSLSGHGRPTIIKRRRTASRETGTGRTKNIKEFFNKE